MRCGQIKRKLSAFFDHELSESEEIIVDEHLKECEGCQSNMKELGELCDIFVRIPDISVPFYFRTRLMQKINAPTEVSLSFIEKFRRAVLPVAAAMAVILSLVLGNYIGENLYTIFAGSSISENDSVEVLDFALNSFPEGSLSDIYQNVLNGEKSE
ncbi:hypothetical protein A2Y85_01870 [candidate division WOR-3 bacterium RBG_13_43_14]|uniref:Putative zinc-finger domain-containing protein n=1 Tax=candidate division WOR-3 bacterium RBG_13_43_14 TaxID=1802590 RepID=A0A1F4UF03_UNCW3|nr:MAG: hypothetical protein A2Y85_01870 [candidate division WOR-3 bacterium RBG_13_43_14]